MKTEGYVSANTPERTIVFFLPLLAFTFNFLPTLESRPCLISSIVLANTLHLTVISITHFCHKVKTQYYNKRLILLSMKTNLLLSIVFVIFVGLCIFLQSL